MNRSTLRFSFPFLAILAALTNQTALPQSQWSLYSTVNTALCTASGNQHGQSLCTDGSGGAIVTWQDIRNGSTYDIYAQRIDASGAVLWSANGVAVCTSAYDQNYPKIVSDGSGGAIITWQDNRGGSYSDIYASRINSLGIVLWAPNGVAMCTAQYDQLSPIIVADGSGGAIISWSDGRFGFQNDVYAQRVNSSGQIQWTSDGVAICTASYDQYPTGIASDTSGGAFIAWLDYRNGVDFNIYGQRIDASGTVQWAGNGAAICTESHDQFPSGIVSDDSGGVIVTWGDLRANSYDVYAQRVSALGATQWTADGVAVSTGPGAQSSPAIVSDNSGGAIITWIDSRNTYGSNIYAQRLNSSGTGQWKTNGVALSTATGNEQNPVIASDGSGGAIVSWESDRTGDFNIYAQHISGSGMIRWANNGTAIATTTSDQLSAAIVSDGSGGAIVAWQDGRNGGGSNFDVYAQRVDNVGGLYGLSPSLDKVGDVANDQGGKLRVFWQPSPLDTWGGTTVKSYTVKMGARSTGLFGKTSASVSSGIYWQTAGSVPADGSEGYTALLSTAADSGLQGTPYYYFQIIPIASDSSLYRPSNIDSAFSIDNIPPVGVGGTSISSSNNGTVTLRWNKDKVDPDLMGYQVYRSSSTGFLLNEATKLAQTTDTAYADGATNIGTHYYYRVAAVDVHGNRGTSSSELSIVTLSIQLSSFTANLDAHSGVQLAWQTATEIDNSGFGIERRLIGAANWQEIGFVAGSGSSNAPHSYSFVDREVPAGHTAYRLRQVSSSGNSSYSFSVEMDVIPTTTTLSQNYPNPFNPSTDINYQLADGANVKLTVHDILGREVSSLVNGHQEPGLYQVRWDASQLPSGVYLYRLQAGSSTIARKMLLQK